jgi:hypothetical protein
MMPHSLLVGSPTIGTPSLISLSKADMRKAFVRWREQRYNSDHRGVPFELSLADWLSAWIDSGHYHERGHRKGQFVMSRPKDQGGYVLGNIAIVLCSANSVEAQSHRIWTDEQRAKIASKLKGNTNGAGHVADAAARERMRQGCADRAETEWLANTTAANRSPAKRRSDSRGVKASWARRRAEASPS